MKLIPPYLKPGDQVALVATARRILREQVLPAADWLKSIGLVPVFSEDLFETKEQFAGDDEWRGMQFNRAVTNPGIKAIWCVRGGYGTARMVDGINFKFLLQNPKWVIGFSDVTVIHSHLNKLGMASIHGPMCINFGDASPDSNMSWLKDCLFGKPLKFDLSSHKGVNLRPFEGEVTGGNVSVLYSIMGSASETSFDGKILLLEDLDEYLYHLDRMMLGLKRAGKLSKLRAVLTGEFKDMKDNEIPFGLQAEEIILSHVENYSIPVITGFPAGHGNVNLAVPFGIKATFSEGTFTFDGS